MIVLWRSGVSSRVLPVRSSPRPPHSCSLSLACTACCHSPVSQRLKEIGIRMALGAGRGDVLRLMVWQGLLPVLIGLAVGVCAAMGATTVLASTLFEIRPSDPATLLGVAVCARRRSSCRGAVAGALGGPHRPIDRRCDSVAQARSSTRPATLATVAMSSEGSTGFETCTRKPRRRARVRSSERANAVRAIAGTHCRRGPVPTRARACSSS